MDLVLIQQKIIEFDSKSFHLFKINLILTKKVSIVALIFKYEMFLNFD